MFIVFSNYEIDLIRSVIKYSKPCISISRGRREGRKPNIRTFRLCQEASGPRSRESYVFRSTFLKVTVSFHNQISREKSPNLAIGSILYNVVPGPHLTGGEGKWGIQYFQGWNLTQGDVSCHHREKTWFSLWLSPFGGRGLNEKKFTYFTSEVWHECGK